MWKKVILAIILVLFSGSTFCKSYAEEWVTFTGSSGLSMKHPNDWTAHSADANSLWDSIISPDGKAGISVTMLDSITKCPPGGSLLDCTRAPMTPAEVLEKEVLPEMQQRGNFEVLDKAAIAINGQDSLYVLIRTGSMYMKVYIYCDNPALTNYVLYFGVCSENELKSYSDTVDKMVKSFKPIPLDRINKELQDPKFE